MASASFDDDVNLAYALSASAFEEEHRLLEEATAKSLKDKVMSQAEKLSSFVPVSNRGGGDCFYLALSFWLLYFRTLAKPDDVRVEAYAKTLREIVATPGTIARFRDYLEERDLKMAKDGTFVSHYAIKVLAEVHDLKIVILRLPANDIITINEKGDETAYFRLLGGESHYEALLPPVVVQAIKYVPPPVIQRKDCIAGNPACNGRVMCDTCASIFFS
jgi:hypothetical protein